MNCQIEYAANGTGLLLFVGSIVILLVCFVLLKLMEDDDENADYWPDDPRK